MNEIEIFDGRRLCSDKLSSDLLPSRFICCTLLHFADHLVFCTCWNPPSPAAKVHTYSTTSSFLESSKQAHCSWAGDATVKVATYSSKNKAELIKIAVARWSLRQRALDTYILWYLRVTVPTVRKIKHSTMKNKIWVQLSTELSLHLQASFDRWNITSPVFKAVLL